jgi:uncharacterized membrane protein HdeD (DUF308 family)
MRVLGIVIVIIGVLAVIAGILYFTEPAHSLPSFFPGYMAHKNVKHPRRGLIAVIIGAILILVGLFAALNGGRRRRTFSSR